MYIFPQLQGNGMGNGIFYIFAPMKQRKVIGFLLLAVYLLMCYHTVIPHDHHTHHSSSAVAENHVHVGHDHHHHHHDADADEHHHFPHHSEESHSVLYLSAKANTSIPTLTPTLLATLPVEWVMAADDADVQIIEYQYFRPKIPKPFLHAFSHRGPPSC